MSDLESSNWSETAASNNASPPDGWPEGMPPSGVNNSAREMMGAIKRDWDRVHGVVSSTGSANAYVVTYTTAPAAYVNGQIFSFKTNFGNTGSATANINSLGAKTINKQTTSGLAVLTSGDMPSGIHVMLKYDSAADVLVWLNPTYSTATTSVVNVYTQVFTSSGTYTPHSGIIKAVIECIGSGAGGGGAAANGGGNTAQAGGGGGAGGYSRIIASAATIGSSQTVTVGSAGTGGSAGNNAGNNGSDVSVGTICVGKGGTGGGGAAAGDGGTGGAGGVAGTGDVAFVGNAGTAGFAASAAAGCLSMGGIGGGGPFGGQPAQVKIGGVNTNTTGNTGANYGAGGGGGAGNGNSAAAGGDGAKGVVIITEYCSA